jgi:transcriptional regulator GlxA family with amidase domain
MRINTVLFDGFEALDAFGPVEILGGFPATFEVRCYSSEGGTVTSTQGVRVVTEPFTDIEAERNALLIPGGIGVVALVRDSEFIERLGRLALQSAYVLTVCTGSILLSKTGLLDGRRATSNKRLFRWTGSESPEVTWIKKARWVKDGAIYTSSGISAGMDMALGFVSDLLGREAAMKKSVEIEYHWREDNDDDPFAQMYY